MPIRKSLAKFNRSNLGTLYRNEGKLDQAEQIYYLLCEMRYWTEDIHQLDGVNEMNWTRYSKHE
jgi:hypothetical protein